MAIWKMALIAVAVVFAGFAAVVATRPAEFRIERSATIQAPAEAVFANVNTLKRWDAWSPWAKLDPQAKHTFEGPEAGVGAVYAWAGNDKVGEGKMTITESTPTTSVKLQLDFVKPWASTNWAEFTFTAEGTGTKVTWAMHGKNNFASRAFGLFVNMDKMIGGDFEQGLAQLKTMTEADAVARK